jgi:Icc-related predicted phosphoesterase
MKILAIGDPHGDLERVRKIPVKSVDLILLTGDLGSASLMRKMAFERVEREKQGLPEREYSPQQSKKAFMEAYTSSIKVVEYLSRFALVYVIYGNVEHSNQETKKMSREIGLPLPFLTDKLGSMRNVRIINNRLANFNGLRVGGLEYFTDTNWVRDFKPSEYREKLKGAKRGTDKARRILRRFDGLDILVCHQPPYGILDKVTAKFAPKAWQGKHAGSETILDYIKRKQPRYVFCGHIHEGEGMKRIGKTEVYNLGVAGYKIIEI